MKPTVVHPLFAKSLTILLLIGLFLTNMASFCYLMMDKKVELLELVEPLHNDSEKEKEKEKDEEKKDDKIRVLARMSLLIDFNIALKKIHLVQFQSLHHPDIVTPPPQQMRFLS